MCRARQHAIFSGNPAFSSLTAKMRRQLVFHGRGADDSRVAHFDQRRAFGVREEVGGDFDGAHFIKGAIVSAKELVHLPIGSLNQ